jgi:hypothetical protein
LRLARLVWQETDLTLEKLEIIKAKVAREFPEIDIKVLSERDSRLGGGAWGRAH